MEAVELEFSFLVKRVHCEYLQIANEKRVKLVKELNRARLRVPNLFKECGVELTSRSILLPLKRGVVFMNAPSQAVFVYLKNWWNVGRALFGGCVLIFSISRTDLRNRCPILIVYSQTDQKAG